MSIDPWLLLRQARTQLARTEFVLRADLQRIVETIGDLDEALEVYEREKLPQDYKRLLEIMEQNHQQVAAAMTTEKKS